MKQFLESFGVAVETTGGLALLAAYSLLPVILLYAGLMAVGRGLWSRGTESKRVKEAEAVLAGSRCPGDELARSIAEDTIRYSKL